MIKTVAQTHLAVNEILKIKKNSIKNGTSKKRMCIVTGIHGDELEGQYLAYLLGSYLQENIALLDGTVDIYPAINPLGIDSITRGIPGFDLDMNRIFPGSRDGTGPEVIATSIISNIEGADVCIDIHSSNIFLREIPQIRINEKSAEELIPLAQMMNVDLIWVHESATVLESTLAYSLNMIGTKTLVVEMGVGMRITKDFCVQLFDGIINLLKNLGFWSGKSKEVRTPILSVNRSVGFVNSDAAGIFVPEKNFGDYVKKGDIIGRVIDPLSGKVIADTAAVCEGTVFTLREYPVVYGGSLIARIISGEEM